MNITNKISKIYSQKLGIGQRERQRNFENIVYYNMLLRLNSSLVVLLAAWKKTFLQSGNIDH